MSEEKKLNGTVIVTYRCNARCSMCNRYKAPSKPEEEISIETIKKLPKMYFTNVIRILGSPTYICVLQRKDRKSIAITPCTAEHPMSFKVPDRLLTDGQCRMMINGIQFIQALLEANGLAAGKDHQFKGRYEAEKNAVIISLENDEREC